MTGHRQGRSIPRASTLGACDWPATAYFVTRSGHIRRLRTHHPAPPNLIWAAHVGGARTHPRISDTVTQSHPQTDRVWKVVAAHPQNGHHKRPRSNLIGGPLPIAHVGCPSRKMSVAAAVLARRQTLSPNRAPSLAPITRPDRERAVLGPDPPHQPGRTSTANQQANAASSSP